MKLHVAFTGLGAGNIGDEAMMQGFLSLFCLPQGTTVEVWDTAQPVLSQFPSTISFVDYKDNARCDYLYRSSDMVLAVGATIVSEMLSLQWPLTVLGEKYAKCHACGVPVHAIGIGADRLRSSGALKLFDRGFKPFKSWTVRSVRSRDNLVIAGVDSEAITVAADLAWLTPLTGLDTEWAGRYLHSLGILPGIPIIGVNVVNEKWKDDADLKKRLAGALEALSASGRRQVAFFCNETREGQDYDKEAALSIAKLMKRRPVIVPNTYFTPLEMLSLVACTAVTISWRYHFTLFSALAGVIPVSVERGEKMEELVEDLEGISLGKPGDATEDDIIAKVEFVHEKQAELKEKQSANVELLKKRSLFNTVFIRDTPGVANTCDDTTASRRAGKKKSSGKAGNGILWIRTDSIGDNILASSMLGPLKEHFPGRELTVVCRSQVAELYAHCPYIDDIIDFDKKRAYCDQNYLEELIDRLLEKEAGWALNTVYSREPITDLITLGSSAKETIAFFGDLANGMTPDLRHKNNALYTKIINDGCAQKSELKRHEEFLRAIGVPAGSLLPRMWLSDADREFAETFFAENGLDSARTIALFPFARHYHKEYLGYASVAGGLKGYKWLIVGGDETAQRSSRLAGEIRNAGDTEKAGETGNAGDTENPVETGNAIDSGNTGNTGNKCVELTGRATLRQSAAAIEKCALYLGADSAGAHMACALGVKNVVILGGGHYGRFFPYSPLTTAVSLPLDCFGCDWQCIHKEPYCVSGIASATVVDAVNGSLKAGASLPRIHLQPRTAWSVPKGGPKWTPPERLILPVTVESNLEGACTPEGGIARDTRVEVDRYSVTAIVYICNSEAFIRECLEDLEAQTMAENIEIIVVDAASTQRERVIIEEFQTRYPNIVYVRLGTGVGVCRAWNMAIKIAGGKCLTLFSTSDRLRKDAYEILYGELEENPDAYLVYGDSYLTDQPRETFCEHTCAGIFKWHDYSFEDLLGDRLIGPNPMWRKSLHDTIGYFDERYAACGDREFWLRLGQTHKILHVAQFTGLHLLTPESLSDKGQVYVEEDYEIRALHQKRYVDEMTKAVRFGSLYNRRSLYVWGAGAGGRKTVDILVKLNLPLAGFIDVNPTKWNSEVNGLAVLPPSVIEEQLSADTRPFVVIASMYHREIKPVLMNRGYRERIDFWTNIYNFRGLAYL
ncbi:MAG: glycosyltransferase [Nitrospirae bacterium]|nr:glycosyltransferase [Nitrospirota bacterium]